MIKSTISSSSEKVAVLGLSRQDMEMLLSGQDILLNLAEIGLPEQRIVILGGETDEQVESEFFAVLNAANVDLGEFVQ